LDGKAKAAQIVPAKLGERGLPGLLSNPGGNLGTSPEPAIRGRTSEQGSKGLLLERGEAGSFARIGGTAVKEGVRTVLVVAMDEVTEPVCAEANDGGSIFGRASSGNQPQGVPAASSGRVGGGFIGREQFVRSEMWMKGEHSWHAWSIYHDLVSGGTNHITVSPFQLQLSPV
jgi:hypothetical protein